MTENLREPRSDELEEQATKLKTQKSEIGKYVAGAFDRLSTAAIVVGFIGARGWYRHEPVIDTPIRLGKDNLAHCCLSRMDCDINRTSYVW